MAVLALHMCTDHISMALENNSQDIYQHTASRFQKGGAIVSVLPMLQNLCKSAGCRIQQLKQLGLTLGVGSFTGMRLGVSFVHGISEALEVSPAFYGFSVAEIWAYAALRKGQHVLDEIFAVCVPTYDQKTCVYGFNTSTEKRLWSEKVLITELPKFLRRHSIQCIVGEASITDTEGLAAAGVRVLQSVTEDTATHMLTAIAGAPPFQGRVYETPQLLYGE